MKHLSIIFFCIIFISCSEKQKGDLPASTDIYEWDFTNHKQITYAYKQTIQNSMVMSGEKINQNISGNGELLLRVLDSSKAEVGLSNMQLRMWDEDTALSINRKIEYGFIQNINTMGKMNSEGEVPAQGVFTFMLPDKSMKVGEKCSMPIKMPFNNYGGQIYFKGTMEITLKEYKVVNGDSCAVYDGKYDIHEADTPTKLKDLSFKLTGDSYIVFNFVEGYIVSSIENIAMDVDSKQVNANMPEPPDAGINFSMQMFMRSHTEINLTAVN